MPHRDQHASSVLDMEDWAKHADVLLDEPVATYRAELNAWIQRRKSRGSVKIFTDASAYIDWPDVPEPTPDPELGPEARPCWTALRRSAKSRNIELIEWQRPAQKTITEGMLVYADGRVVDASSQV